MARRSKSKSKSAQDKGKGKAVESPLEIDREDTKALPNQTPVKATADTLHKNHHEVIQAPVAKKQFNKDMRGLTAGPIPEEEFLDTFLPIQDPHYPGHDEIENADFALVWNPNVPLEVRMYNPLATELNTRGFNREFIVYIASDAPEVRSGTPLRPDLGMVKKSVTLLTRANTLRDQDSSDEEGRRNHGMSLRKAQRSNARAGPSKKPDTEKAKSNGLFQKLRRSVRTRFLPKSVPKTASSTKVSYSTPKHPFQWAHSELTIEVKRDPLDDCFEDNKERIERPGQEAADRRGQLASYFKEQAERQHRTHIFQVYIFGPFARFLRWDRSGVCVSAKFNYQTPKGARTLAGFFWRYCQLTDQQRGWDTSVSLATDEESQEFADLVPDMVKKKVGNRPNLPDYQKSFDDYQTHKLDVLFEQQNRIATIYIRRAFVPSHSPCGRATRGYIAYDPGVISTDEVKPNVYFMKDTWRTAYAGHDSEAKTYTKLSEKEVPNLPVILHAGDVLANEGGQITQTDYWLRATKAWSNLVNMDARSLMHHRLIQEIAVPLGSAKDSKSMVSALADAGQTIIDAHDKAGILHRDVSINNIMIDPATERGILNDWDHSGPAPQTEDEGDETDNPSRRRIRAGFRTGTWQFMSVALLSDLGKVHNRNDDMESLTWVTVVAALKYCKHNNLDFNMSIFDYIDHSKVDGHEVTTGGVKKDMWLYDLSGCGQYRKTKWTCTYLTQLIHSLCKSYATSHDNFKIALRAAPEPDSAQPQFSRDAFMPTPETLLQLFTKLIALEVDWSDGDIVSDQFPPKKRAKTERMDDEAYLEWIKSTTRQVAITSSATIDAHAPMRPRPAIGGPIHLPDIAPADHLEPPTPEMHMKPLDESLTDSEDASSFGRPLVDGNAGDTQSGNRLRDVGLPPGSIPRKLRSAVSRGKTPVRQEAAESNAVGEPGPSTRRTRSSQRLLQRIIREDPVAETSNSRTRSRKRSRDNDDHEVDAVPRRQSKKKRMGGK